MSLEIGTVEPIIEEKKKKKKPSRLSGGEGGGGNPKNRGGGGGGGNNGGDNNPDNQNFRQVDEEFKPNKSRIVMWFLLLVVVMTFGGLISAYIVISTNRVPEWQPFKLPWQIWLSTVLILASSATYHFANSKLQNNQQLSAKKWLLATTALGGIFISSQLLAWLELVKQGIYVKGNPYAGFFYILTFVHAAHVLGGIGILGYIVLRTWNETASEEEMLRRKTFSKVAGWYWHFMGGLWIVLFLLLDFWK
jgi:cytochrome c oxidase subunit III